jgi:hypothetical protein
MAVTVKRIVLWRCEVDNKVGALAATLAPLTTAGADLEVVMGYGLAGDPSMAAIEMYPIVGKKLIAAAKAAGLSAATIPALHVTGDNKAGMGYATTQALADAGINMQFLVAHVLGRKYTAVFGFASDADARRAATIIKKVAGGAKLIKPPTRPELKPARRPAPAAKAPTESSPPLAASPA